MVCSLMLRLTTPCAVQIKQYLKTGSVLLPGEEEEAAAAAAGADKANKPMTKEQQQAFAFM